MVFVRFVSGLYAAGGFNGVLQLVILVPQLAQTTAFRQKGQCVGM
jgi:hypothetical protein